MRFNPEIHDRRSIRLASRDYSKAGMYFITICTQDRQHLFGDIIGTHSICAPPHMLLNDAGAMVEKIYISLQNEFTNIILHTHIIMPNHFHSIIQISNGVKMNSGADMESAPTISTIIQSFKRQTTIEYIKGVKSGFYLPFNNRLWQRSYFDRIIRNEQELHEIEAYIQTNPSNWKEDTYFQQDIT